MTGQSRVLLHGKTPEGFAGVPYDRQPGVPALEPAPDVDISEYVGGLAPTRDLGRYRVALKMAVDSLRLIASDETPDPRGLAAGTVVRIPGDLLPDA